MAASDDSIGSFLDQSCGLIQQLDRAAIARGRDLLLNCYRNTGRVFTMGNGGSASTAQHFACDLAKFVVPPGHRPFDTRCLTDNVSLYTAWANDADRADVFVNLLRGVVRCGDVVIACSVHGGKGFSADLARAVRFANESGASTLSLVGFDGGVMHRESTVSILVPVASTPQVEAIHLVIEHLLMSLIKEALGGSLDER
jgi:D-sedoheptulose 7-phosphate isomerase